jgi:crooked neck
MERQEAEPKPPRQRIADPEEMRELQARKRKQFEDALRRQRYVINNWIKYAVWEDSQGEVDRYEPALAWDFVLGVSVMKHQSIILAMNTRWHARASGA